MLSPDDARLIHDNVLMTTNVPRYYTTLGGGCGDFVFNYIKHFTGKLIVNADNLINTQVQIPAHYIGWKLTHIADYNALTGVPSGTPCVICREAQPTHTPVHYFILYRIWGYYYAYGQNHGGCLMNAGRGHPRNILVRRINPDDFDTNANFRYQTNPQAPLHRLYWIDVNLF